MNAKVAEIPQPEEATPETTLFYRVVDSNRTYLMTEEQAKLPDTTDRVRTVFMFLANSLQQPLQPLTSPDNESSCLDYSYTDMFLLTGGKNQVNDLPRSKEERKRLGIEWDGTLYNVSLGSYQDIVNAFGQNAVDLMLGKNEVKATGT